MIQHAKLMSPAGLASAKQEINEALNDLKASPSNAQSVYTNLTRILSALADHPQAQLAVDSTLATEERVKLLRGLVQIHLCEEEVQWVLGRVIALACQASIRFQCQAGRLEMWSELFDMRSAHAQSIRVQEASLRACEVLFRSNELHVTKLRPRQLMDDLLGVMDRFLRVETPRRRAHALVVAALRVLVALYSSPRPIGLMLFNGERSTEGSKWPREISRRMLDSFAVFNREVASIRSWLDMALLLLRQHPVQALEALFAPAPSKETTWWLAAVVETWQPQAEVMSALLATLTHLFALPHSTLGDEVQVALAEKLILEQRLLGVVCGVVDHYHRASRALEAQGTGSTNEDAAVLVLLEATRVARQWSERPKLAPRFAASQGSLLPVLIEQLEMQSKLPSKRLVFVLEILLLLRHLAVHRVLLVSESLHASLKWLRCGSSIGGSPCAGHDGDLHALVAREARDLHQLIGSGICGAESTTRDRNPRSVVVVSRAVAVQRRRRAENVKPETLAAYRR
ncbi:hypothetical protein PHYPSEUDO_009927 [Phytophthora pseudosyringae]|uniref:Uncharacterized protein n=1 Tax=Phytophthora pseudosyringae TaxID=221518 RepID=A0A8T1VBB4_9STRA|nr:hypothetical protein PHYPSEUDO_009927 [Phytophthora pseudosyringae]